MYLTSSEERVLAGERGPALSTAMRLLTTLGDVFGAEKLVRIKSAHVSGVSYQNIGDTGLEFLENIGDMGAKVAVTTTLNPCGMDRLRWREFGVPVTYAKKQLRILSAFERMSLSMTCSCTPYHTGNKPLEGHHIAWSESSALIFANSVFGARTNRESGISALASAFTGKTPSFGLHNQENRRPTCLVDVRNEIRSELDYSALGYFVGKLLNSGVPFFKGLKTPNQDQLKALAAGLGASSSIGLFHVGGVTPEARKISQSQLESCERLTFQQNDLDKTVDDLSSETRSDLVFLGCPQASLNQLRSIAKQLRKKILKEKLWICTSRAVYEKASHEGVVGRLEEHGARILCDTCVEVCPLKALGVNSILTDSCKAAQYVRSVSEVEVSLRSTSDCLKAAVK